MIINDPDPYLLPTYRMSPFSTRYVHINANLELESDDLIRQKISERYHGRSWGLTHTGRTALNQALNYYRLEKTDCVTVLTTSGNFYVSSCVTGEIEKFCNWSRELTPSTKVILVVHEFGFPHENMEEIMSWGYPVIEDCAYSFDSQDLAGKTGFYGDFTLYSLPKYFPVQVGGILTWKKELPKVEIRDLDSKEKNYLLAVLDSQWDKLDKIKDLRQKNYSNYTDLCRELSITPRFQLNQRISPGAFLLNCPAHWDLPKLKLELQRIGIQCSVFYGEQAFYLPCHQELEKEDILFNIYNLKVRS